MASCRALSESHSSDDAILRIYIIYYILLLVYFVLCCDDNKYYEKQSLTMIFETFNVMPQRYSTKHTHKTFVDNNYTYT
jgi:hypothetical protein